MQIDGYLKRVELFNYQKHAHLIVDFEPGANMIHGDTDAGKSAILRAIYWVLENDPAGMEDFKTGAKYCRVILYFSDGIIIEKYRSSSRNEYKLTQDGKESLFEDVDRDVPDPVRSAANFCKTNFQEQFDLPFMFSETAGKVARSLNESAQLSVIDLSLRNIGKTVKDLKYKNKTSKELLEEYNKKISELSYIDQMEKDVADLDHIKKQLKTVEISIATLNEHAIKCSQLQNEIERDNGLITQTTPYVDRLKAVIIEAVEIRKQLTNLEQLRSRQSACRKELEMHSSLVQAAPVVDKLQSVLESHQVIGRRLKHLQELRKKQQDCQKQMKSLQESIEEIKKSRPKICPECGQEICDEPH